MALNKQSGFTLIEIIIVMAISGGLFVIVFAGQQQLRDRSRFDAAINLLLQASEYTRNYAESGINETGHGDENNTAVDGVSLELDNAHTESLVEMEPMYANYDDNDNLLDLDENPASGSCPNSSGGECWEKYFNLGTTGLHITTPGVNHFSIYFFNLGDTPRICAAMGDDWTAPRDSCSLTTNPHYGLELTFEVADDSGQTATIKFDPGTGKLSRIN
jgi:prepilin-type N-terminal cleavage/methylation domain-containing protein